MELFNKLGRDIEQLWCDANFSEDALPAIAADALRRHDIPSKMSAWDIMPWALGEIELPPQKDATAKFGDPPITLFVGSRFYIDVYFWFEGTTATHQHGFCGAFQVLTGSSIHSWYEFTPRHAVNTFMQFGDISLKVCELLGVGDVQEIWGGRRYIHSLFHLDHPSATIVVRTERSPLDLPQFSYQKPTLAVDPFYDDTTMLKKMQIMAALIRGGRPDADDQIAALLERSDLHSSYLYLNQLRAPLGNNQVGELFGLTASTDRFERFLSIVEKRHGELGRELRPVFEEIDIVEEMVKRRGYVRESDHRFFMALLLNSDGREQIFGLIKQRFPDADPIEKVLDWVYDLAQTRVLGVDTPNALGIAGLGDAELTVLEKVLNGTPANGLSSAVATELPASDAASIDAAIAKVTSAVIFRPLMTP
jgi:hypothetical protein